MKLLNELYKKKKYVIQICIEVVVSRPQFGSTIQDGFLIGH